MHKKNLGLYLIFLVLVIFWCSAIIFLPYIKTYHNMISDSGYEFFSKICHQKSERSLYIFSEQMPVCSRCFAIYFGFLFGTFIYPSIIKIDKIPDKKWLIIFCLPMLLDGGLQFIGPYDSNNFTRIITGGLAGFIGPFYIIPGFFEMAEIIKKYLKNRKSKY